MARNIFREGDRPLASASEDPMRIRYVIGVLIYVLALAGMFAAWSARGAGALT
jgi:hypothetical protein